MNYLNRCSCLHLIIINLLFSSTSLSRQSIKPRSASNPITQLDQLSSIVNLSDPDSILNFHSPNSLLHQILIPRQVGSQNLNQCRSIFEQHFLQLSKSFNVPPTSHIYQNQAQSPSYQPISRPQISTWQLESHTFTDQTPLGPKTFINQIFTHDPTASLRLILAAHIDSKITPDQFIGATDSAAPVAIILEIVRAITPLLDQSLQDYIHHGDLAATEERITLQVVLLDGEEAFEAWSHTDSIYGARALAKKWAQPIRTPTALSKQINQLDTIQAFVLLDLLGSPHSFVHNLFHETTGWMYQAWQAIEQRLDQANLLYPASSNLEKPMAIFATKPGSLEVQFFGAIEDDHLPFMAGGVPILHLIAAPFPSVWHQIGDNRDALDYNTLCAWARIGQVALVEYFGLLKYIEPSSSRKRDELIDDQNRFVERQSSSFGSSTEL